MKTGPHAEGMQVLVQIHVSNTQQLILKHAHIEGFMSADDRDYRVNVEFATGTQVHGCAPECVKTFDQVSEEISKEFSRLIAECLLPAELKQVNDLNEKAGYSKEVCHTHDFCDANEVMILAFENVMGFDVSFASDVEGGKKSAEEYHIECDLQDRAWAISKKNNFTSAA